MEPISSDNPGNGYPFEISFADLPNYPSQWETGINLWVNDHVPYSERASYQENHEEDPNESLFFFVAEFQMQNDRFPLDRAELDEWINTPI